MHKKQITINLLSAILFSVAVILITVIFCTTFAIYYYNGKLSKLNEFAQHYSKIAMVNELYDEMYINETDPEQMIDYAIRGMVIGSEDKYGAYLDKEDYASTLLGNQSKLVGIGVSAVLDNETGTLRILRVFSNSPAESAGLLAGDLIVEVEEESTKDLGFYASVNKIAGQENTTVNLTILRNDETIPFDVTRQVIDVPSVESHMIGENIGYISISEFNRKTPEQLKEKMDEISGISGLKGCIIDVRNNGGGDADGVVDSLDLFIDDGTIVSFVDKEGNTEDRYATEGAYDIPVIILTNESTASAAELFAEAMRESANAEIVGTTTYGKGVSQTIVSLKDGTALVVTNTKYYTPNGENYDGIGVIPDYEVEMPEALLQRFYSLTDEEDNQISYAVNLLK